MHALVLGGCGFIGSHIVDALRGSGHRVRVLDLQLERFRPPIEGVAYLTGSFLDRDALKQAMADVDVVFHLVSTTLPATSNIDPARDVKENLLGSLLILETMIEAGVGRIVFLSSGGTVYGIPKTIPIPESHSLRPICSYGVVKVAIEQYIRMYSALNGMSYIIVRASNPYGPRQGHLGTQGAISTFLYKALKGLALNVWGDGSIVRDYLHVTDLAQFCSISGESTRSGTYNAGSGEGTSLIQVVAAIQGAIGRPLDVKFGPGREVDVPRSVLDCSRASNDFGWVPKIGLNHGIAELWEWLLRNA